VYEKRPTDTALLIPAIESQEEQLGRVPQPVVGDAASTPQAMKNGRAGLVWFYFQAQPANETKTFGIAVPAFSRRSSTR
jgi:hypothetical protein